MNAPQGRVYWAVAPFSPRSPFELYAGSEHAPIQATTKQIVNGVRQGGDAQFAVIVPVKARPVLVLTELLAPFDEVLALRLRSFDKLDPGTRQRVRDQEEEALFHLPPGRFDLPQENAAIVTALLRLPMSAVDDSDPRGALDDNELRVVHERVARAHQLRLDVLVVAQARRLLNRLRDSGE